MNNNKIPPELLAPAGSLEKLAFAIEYGADAVYLGAKSFSLREGAANFTMEEMSQAVEYCHSLGKKAYLTANIFFHNHHFTKFQSFMNDIRHIPLDGIIMSDIGAISFIREQYPHLAVHISTQANTTSAASAKFYEQLGVKRIILARELSIDEIKQIRDAVTLELETFVHGAMCISYSGRCLLSNYFTNPAVYRQGEKMGNMKKVRTRDANLGDCAQSCRWEYYLVESTRQNDLIPIIEDEQGTSILSSKDMNLSANLDKLIDAGVNSFKIEGRIKSAYYVANVTRVYRHAIDQFMSGKKPEPAVLEELDKISHREYTTGFFFGENLALTATKNSQYLRDYTFLGHITEVLSKDEARVQSMNQILPGKPIEAIFPDGTNIMIENYELIKDGKPVDKIQPNELFILSYSAHKELKKRVILRRE